MSRQEVRPGMLQLLGLATLVAVAGLGMLAASIPGWRAPEMTEWTATIPRQQGARGLEPGGHVLIGGLPQGRILSVDDESGLTDPQSRTLIAVQFELPSTIELGRDAVIRKSVGIAGTNGVLDIPNPGSRDRRFASDEPRRLAIDTSPPAGGSIGVLIGRRNGERIEAIADAGDRFGTRLPPRLQMITAAARMLLDEAETMDREIGNGTNGVQRRIDHLAARIGGIGARWMDLPPMVASLRDELGAFTRAVVDELDGWRPTFDSIVARTDHIRIEVDSAMEDVDRWTPELRRLESQLTAALEDLGATRTRLSLLAPDLSDGLARTMARMVLAGGQLARAIDDLLPLALEAITTRPDRASASRRQLLEAVADAVQAGTDVRDAARRMDTLARDAEAMPLGDETLDATTAERLDRRVDDLERLLEVLSDHLRLEIEREIGLRPRPGRGS